MANNAEFGLYVPSTYVWDVEQLRQIDIQSPEFKELLIRLYQNINSITTALNLKDSGYYDTLEFVTGSQLFPNPSLSSSSSTVPTFRNIYRTTVNFGALPNTAAKAVAHGIPITAGYSFVKIYGAASDQAALSFIPLPYASPTLANNIQVDVDATNVTITTGSNRTNFTIAYVVLEYIKF